MATAPALTVKGTNGISNLNNTWHLNAALQCLSNLKDFTDFIQSQTKLKEKTLAHSFKRFLDEKLSENNNLVDPTHLINTIYKITGKFKARTQNDLQEFVSHFITILSEELKSKVMENLFSGALKNVYTCSICKNVSHQALDKFYTLNVPVPPRSEHYDYNTFIDCLNEFLKIRTLNEWKCEACQKDTIHSFSVTLEKIPSILLVRFTFSKGANKNMSLNKYLIDNGFSHQLVGLIKFDEIVDENSVTIGNYTAYCKNPVDNNWYFCNDAQVRSADAYEVAETTPYFLIYEKQ